MKTLLAVALLVGWTAIARADIPPAPNGSDAGVVNHQGGCSVVPDSSFSTELGALAVVGSVSLLFFLRRRKS